MKYICRKYQHPLNPEAEQLLDLGYDNDVLAKMVFMNFMNAKELFNEGGNN